jgi:hypothetical protein
MPSSEDFKQRLVIDGNVPDDPYRPFNLLPLEVIEAVFCALMSSTSIPAYHEELSHLLLISKGIKEVVETTPGLWTVIDTRTSTLKRISASLHSLSKAEPLIINIVTANRASNSAVRRVAPILDLISLHAHRWRCLRIGKWHSAFPSLQSVLNAFAPNLRYCFVDNSSPLRLGGAYPELTTIESHGVWPLGTGPTNRLVGLRRLTFSKVSGNNIPAVSLNLLRRVFGLNPNLEVFRFAARLSNDIPADGEDIHISLTHLQCFILDALECNGSVELARLIFGLGPRFSFAPEPFARLRSLEIRGWKTSLPTTTSLFQSSD